MGMSIDTPLIAYSELTDEIYIIDKEAKYCVTDKVMKVVVATNRAIPKADYENRLKADMVAALKELQLEIEEIETGGDAWELGIKDECKAVIKKKIDALEYDLKRGNNGNNVRQTD